MTFLMSTKFSQPGDGDVPRLPGSRSPSEPARLVPRGKHNVPREFVAATQRERLLDALALLIAERGYQATTVADIVAAAGVSTKTFYEQFPDKQACFMAAYDFGTEILYSRVGAAYEQARSWPQSIRAGIEVLLGLLAAEPAFARLCVVEVNAAGAPGLARRQAVLATFEGFLDAPGRRPPFDSQTINRATVGGIYECIYTAITDGRTEQLTELAGPLVYMALLPFVGPSKARAVAAQAHSTSAPPRVTLKEVRSHP
jgi:AcrR family transcriptional regulator